MSSGVAIGTRIIRELAKSCPAKPDIAIKVSKKGGLPAQTVKRIVLGRLASICDANTLENLKGDTYSCSFGERESTFRFAVTASRNRIPWFNITLNEAMSLDRNGTTLLVIWNKSGEEDWCRKLFAFCVPPDELANSIRNNATAITRSQLKATLRKIKNHQTELPSTVLTRASDFEDIVYDESTSHRTLESVREQLQSLFEDLKHDSSSATPELKKLLGDLRESLYTVLIHIEPSKTKGKGYSVQHNKTDSKLVSLSNDLFTTLDLSDAESIALDSGYSQTIEIEEDDDRDGASEAIAHPYDPSKSKIDTRPLTIDLLVKRIREDEIDLAPPFQRKAGLWSIKQKSQLIESLLIRIPLPAFYFDATNASRWLVVDGLQRLTTFKEFILGDMKLDGLEYLVQCNGKSFGELPRPLRRDIEESQVTVHSIQPGTPAEVKFNIFRRVNTGGLVLTPQEIRHALNQGPVIGLLNDLAELPEFLTATKGSIPSERMADREFVLRFLAFTICPYQQYKAAEMDSFLSAQMARLNAEKKKFANLTTKFVRAMTTAANVFGKHAFRKQLYDEQPRSLVNKALFEAWSVTLGALTSDQVDELIEERSKVVQA
jgi:hypothetical protein